MRRDKNDLKWKAVKERVTKRDKNRCRFLLDCTVKEVQMLCKYAPKNLLTRLDHCHIWPVSLYPHLCYVDENIVLMNRYVHHNLDDCKHPITGELITREERDEYWKRIVGETSYEKLLDLAKGETNGKEKCS